MQEASNSPQTPSQPSSHKLLEAKNQWLQSLVDVRYPTPESQAGAKLYLQRQQDNQVLELDKSIPVDNSNPWGERVDAFYLVDFHRLTVYFAQLHASQWEAAQQAVILEFLAQIILDPEHEIYLGFHGDTPVVGFIVSKVDDGVLFSDFAIEQSDQAEDKQASVNALILSFLTTDCVKKSQWDLLDAKCYVEISTR